MTSSFGKYAWGWVDIRIEIFTEGLIQNTSKFDVLIL